MKPIVFMHANPAAYLSDIAAAAPASAGTDILRQRDIFAQKAAEASPELRARRAAGMAAYSRAGEGADIEAKQFKSAKTESRGAAKLLLQIKSTTQMLKRRSRGVPRQSGVVLNRAAG